MITWAGWSESDSPPFLSYDPAESLSVGQHKRWQLPPDVDTDRVHHCCSRQSQSQPKLAVERLLFGPLLFGGFSGTLHPSGKYPADVGDIKPNLLACGGGEHVVLVFAIRTLRERLGLRFQLVGEEVVILI